LNKIITITGVDGVGKWTQARLLAEALGPDTTLMSFPEYDRPIGRILRGIYTDRAVQVNLWDVRNDWAQEGEIERLERTPMLIQLLNTLARVEAQDRIGAALEKGHVVMDRYDMDTFIYGLAQGVNLKHLMALDDMLTYHSDFVFYLYGAQFDRAGVRDVNERNAQLQDAVATACVVTRDACPNGYAMNVRGFDRLEKITSIHTLHREICEVLRDRIVQVQPLDREKIVYLVEQSDREKQEVLS